MHNRKNRKKLVGSVSSKIIKASLASPSGVNVVERLVGKLATFLTTFQKTHGALLASSYTETKIALCRFLNTEIKIALLADRDSFGYRDQNRPLRRSKSPSGVLVYRKTNRPLWAFWIVLMGILVSASGCETMRRHYVEATVRPYREALRDIREWKEEYYHGPMADAEFVEAGNVYRCHEGEVKFYRMEAGLGYGHRCLCLIEEEFEFEFGVKERFPLTNRLELRDKWVCLSYFQTGEERTYLDEYVNTDVCGLQLHAYAGNLCEVINIREVNHGSI